MNEIAEVLPESMKNALSEIPEQQWLEIEEVRIRINRPVELIRRGQPVYLSYAGTAEDAHLILSRLSNYSMYTLEEELKKGYVTIRGGHRVGLAGRVITENGGVKGLRDIASFNIRIARQKLGIASPASIFISRQLAEYADYRTAPNRQNNTSPECTRLSSTGKKPMLPVKTGIVDERSEIAGCLRGIPQHQFGQRIDVLDACPKAEGLMMMIRSMSPEVMIVDEIGRMEDTDALLEALHAGVSVIVSAHGWSISDLMKRPSLKRLWEERAFDRYLELSRAKGPGTVSQIYDKDGNVLSRTTGVKTC